MAIKTWIATAEVDMDASRYDTVIVKANTERKARIMAEDAFKKKGHFFVTNLKIRQDMDTTLCER